MCPRLLLKPFSMQTLLVAVARAIESDRATHALLVRTLAVEKLYAALTPREREVFEAIIEGKTNKQKQSAKFHIVHRKSQ